MTYSTTSPWPRPSTKPLSTTCLPHLAAVQHQGEWVLHHPHGQCQVSSCILFPVHLHLQPGESLQEFPNGVWRRHLFPQESVNYENFKHCDTSSKPMSWNQPPKPCSLCPYKGFEEQHFTFSEKCIVKKLSSPEILQIMDASRSCPSCSCFHGFDYPCNLSSRMVLSRPVPRAAKTGSMCCRNRFHVLPKPVSYIWCWDRFHVLLTPVSYAAEIGSMCCQDQFHVLPRPIPCPADTGFMCCWDRFHILLKMNTNIFT